MPSWHRANAVSIGTARRRIGKARSVSQLAILFDTETERVPVAEDLYQTLGVGRDATKTDVQKAYRKLARKYHPDMNPGDDKAQERFKRIQEAYDVLSDEDKRAAYDRYGADFEKIRSGGWQPGAGGGPSFDGLDLEEIFGGAGGGRGGFQFEGGFADFFEQLMGAGAAPRRRAATRWRAAARWRSGRTAATRVEYPPRTGDPVADRGAGGGNRVLRQPRRSP